LKLSGYVSDRNGYKFEINGTYDLTVANSLDIETELLPGTPFAQGLSGVTCAILSRLQQ